MTKNIGVLDRIVRVALGLGIVYFAVQAGSWWGLVGVALLATATVEFCGLYKLLGISTCRKCKAHGSAQKSCCKK